MKTEQLAKRKIHLNGNSGKTACARGIDNSAGEKRDVDLFTTELNLYITCLDCIDRLDETFINELGLFYSTRDNLYKSNIPHDQLELIETMILTEIKKRLSALIHNHIPSASDTKILPDIRGEEKQPEVIDDEKIFSDELLAEFEHFNSNSKSLSSIQKAKSIECLLTQAQEERPHVSLNYLVEHNFTGSYHGIKAVYDLLDLSPVLQTAVDNKLSRDLAWLINQKDESLHQPLVDYIKKKKIKYSTIKDLNEHKQRAFVSNIIDKHISLKVKSDPRENADNSDKQLENLKQRFSDFNNSFEKTSVMQRSREIDELVKLSGKSLHFLCKNLFFEFTSPTMRLYQKLLGLSPILQDAADSELLSKDLALEINAEESRYHKYLIDYSYRNELGYTKYKKQGLYWSKFSAAEKQGYINNTERTWSDIETIEQLEEKKRIAIDNKKQVAAIPESEEKPQPSIIPGETLSKSTIQILKFIEESEEIDLEMITEKFPDLSVDAAIASLLKSYLIMEVPYFQNEDEYYYRISFRREIKNISPENLTIWEGLTTREAIVSRG